MPIMTESQWVLLSEKLGAKARSFIWPGKRIYTQSDNKLIVPSDLLAHPFTFLCGDQAPEKAALAQFESDYPVRQIVQVTLTGLQVFPLCDTPPLSEAELRRRFATPVDDAIRIELLQQWSTCKLPLYHDSDYMFGALTYALSHFLDGGLDREEALFLLARLILGLAIGPAVPRELWREPGEVFRMTCDRGALLVSEAVKNDRRWACLSGAGWIGESQTVLSDTVLLRVAYHLAPVDWQTIEWDLLGPLYTAGLPSKIRRSSGVYFTPPGLVDEVLDSSGILETDSDTGLILEPCAGTGAFVVRLLARTRSTAKAHQGTKHNVRQVLQRLTAVEPAATAFRLLLLNVATQWAIACGDEIEPLPECNFEQADALMGYSPFHAGVVHHNDSSEIGLVGKPLGTSIDSVPTDNDPSGLGDSISVKKAYRWNNEAGFAYVLGNPPYVGESGHRSLFAPYRADRFWCHFSESKMDFLQYFIVLGLSKVQSREGGRVCYLTSAYWLTSDGAELLRDFILRHAKIKSVSYILGERSQFTDAPGHHNAIVVLERCSNEDERRLHEIKVRRLQPLDEGGSLISVDPTTPATTRRAARPVVEVEASLFPDKQSTLARSPWFLQTDPDNDLILRALAANSPLEKAFAAKQGVAPGAQKIGPTELAALGPAWVKNHDIHEGEGVFVLSGAEVDSLNLPPDETRFLKPFVKNSSIKPYQIKRHEALWLIYLRHDQVRAEECPRLISHLARYLPLLQRKREFQTGKRDWFHIHWPRDEAMFSGEKIMTAQRGSRPAFAWVVEPLFAATDVYYIVRKNVGWYPWISMRVLCSILNSNLGWFWFAHRTKVKGNQSEFFSKAILQFPLPDSVLATPANDYLAIIEKLERLTGWLCQMENSVKDSHMILEQVNQYVYQLYGLSPQQIEQVDAWVKSKQP